MQRAGSSSAAHKLTAVIMAKKGTQKSSAVLLIYRFCILVPLGLSLGLESITEDYLISDNVVVGDATGCSLVQRQRDGAIGIAVTTPGSRHVTW